MQFLIRETGPVDVSWVYAESGGNISDLRFLNERGLVLLGESQVWRDPLTQYEFQPGEVPPLTKDQLGVWSIIQEQIRMAVSGKKVQPLLLHGVTGSGKTEIYLHAAEEVLALGKQAIILVPEIALTPQSVKRFAGRFPGRVGLLHSGLSDGERYDTWRRARSGDLSVLIGPRSALFTPFSNLGLIVVDESHDDSYYQTDPAPHYHARQAAIIYARLMNAVCLLGSATPDVVSIHRCRQGRWRYLSLPSRIIAHRQTVQAQVDRLGGIESRYRTLEAQAEVMELPPVSVVDMRQELKSDNRSIFSRELQMVLGQTLKRDQQAILFLNRRGTATYVFCRDCGFTLKCPRCDIPLTYHAARGLLTCHYCGYKRKMPEICPQCKSRRIRHYGTGTQKVEAEVQALFPRARTLRWDYETTRKKGAHQVILSHFLAHRADVLIGTQMLAKGLDLPFVTLVGVVLADVGLNLPDYRATERTFQVLTQVAGRAGRSPLRLEYTHTDFYQAEQAAKKLAAQIREWLRIDSRRATRMIGPVPCFFERLGGMYRWQIIISGPDPVSLLRDRKMVDWKVEVDPPSLL
jgi:primosomal protein N' (replication factor Y)